MTDTHDPVTCPACILEQETGETAPADAHRWRAPTAAELEAHQRRRITREEGA